MKEVILSHDSEAKIYLVPDEVADNLDKYCWDFAANWVWHGPENAKFLREIGNGQMGDIIVIAIINRIPKITAIVILTALAILINASIV